MVVCEREAFFTVFDDHGTLHQPELMCYINGRVHIIRPVSHQTRSKLRERFAVFPSGTAYRAVVVSTVAVAGGCTMDLIIPFIPRPFNPALADSHRHQTRLSSISVGMCLHRGGPALGAFRLCHHHHLFLTSGGLHRYHPLWQIWRLWRIRESSGHVAAYPCWIHRQPLEDWDAKITFI